MAKPFNRTVTLIGIYKQLRPFIRPYRTMILWTLFLTFLGAITAQVNAVVLKFTTKLLMPTDTKLLPTPIL
ncbi:MAG: hypothetical protein QM564_00350 [Bergeyella sp.]